MNRSSHTWTLILAAGASSRFGGPKALAIWNGETLLARAIATAKGFSGENVLVVTGGHAEALKSHLQEVKSIFNDSWANGMSSSILKGVTAIRDLDLNSEMILILPVDQPLVESSHLQKLAADSLSSGCCVLTRNSEGTLGAPAALPRDFFSRATELRGDRGLKSVLTENEMMTVENSRALIDVDHPDDLKKLDE
jgi:molybdenum cofactor cytidylyltransferase